MESSSALARIIKSFTAFIDYATNPSYRGATLAFNGRQLTSYTKGSNAISYKYDASGLRASKTVNGGTTTYQYVGDKLYFEQRADGSKLYYFYDSYGNLTHLYYHVGQTKTAYNIVTNSQGDVIAIYNWNGNQLVASYSYDAWGNCTITQDTTGIGAINPIRYRGYYFDSEIGMYYLQSRYYDPNTGRFINSDKYLKTPDDSVLSTNMFAYCENNPISRSDSTGQWFGLDDLVAGTVGAIVGVASQFVSDVATSAIKGSLEFSNWQTYVGAGVGGAIGGVTTLYAGPVVGVTVGSGSATLFGQTLENFTGGKKRSAGEIIENTLIDAGTAFLVSKLFPIKISGVTSGRNCMAAVFQSGLTKLGNGTASTMSAKVFGKGIVSEFVSDLPITVVSIIKSLGSELQQSK